MVRKQARVVSASMVLVMVSRWVWHDVATVFGSRCWRVRAIEKISAFDMLRLNVLVSKVASDVSKHLGYYANDPVGRNGENSRNGVRAKSVITRLASRS